MAKEPISRIYSIVEKIEFIEHNIAAKKGIYNALEDEVTARPAILMLPAGIAEQFNKLNEENASELLSYFEDEDLKGMRDVRNFIAHEYEGVELAIIEWLLRNALPKLKNQCLEAITQYESNHIS